MQENRHAREPNHENGSLPEILCLDPTRKVSSHPMDEDGHSCRLNGERQGAEDGGRKSLAEKFHRSRQLVRYDEIHPATTTGEFTSVSQATRLPVHPMPFPCETLDHTGVPSERCQLLVDERHLDQLHIDRETQPPVDLIEQRGFPARKHFAERRHIFQSQLHD